jgi:hypothetical protein
MFTARAFATPSVVVTRGPQVLLVLLGSPRAFERGDGVKR